MEHVEYCYTEAEVARLREAKRRIQVNGLSGAGSKLTAHLFEQFQAYDVHQVVLPCDGDCNAIGSGFVECLDEVKTSEACLRFVADPLCIDGQQVELLPGGLKDSNSHIVLYSGPTAGADKGYCHFANCNACCPATRAGGGHHQPA